MCLNLSEKNLIISTQGICISSKQGVKMAGLVMTVISVTVKIKMKFVTRRQGSVNQVVQKDLNGTIVQV